METSIPLVLPDRKARLASRPTLALQEQLAFKDDKVIKDLLEPRIPE